MKHFSSIMKVLFHSYIFPCILFIYVMSSICVYHADRRKDQEQALQEKVSPDCWLLLRIINVFTWTEHGSAHSFTLPHTLISQTREKLWRIERDACREALARRPPSPQWNWLMTKKLLRSGKHIGDGQSALGLFWNVVPTGMGQKSEVRALGPDTLRQVGEGTQMRAYGPQFFWTHKHSPVRTLGEICIITAMIRSTKRRRNVLKEMKQTFS